MIEAKNIQFSYGTVPVLKGLSFEAPGSAITAIIGANGCGKSTLLRCLLGLLRIAPRTAWLNGQDLSDISAKEQSRLLGYIPQDNRAPARMSVFDAVLLGRKPYFDTRPSSQDLAMTEAALETFGLSHLALRTMDTLSGGQRQTVWIAKAYCQDTPAILLDEPTASLDIKHILETRELLQVLAQSGKTLLLTSHDLVFCRSTCHHFVTMLDGKVFQEGDSSVLHPQSLAPVFDVSPSTIETIL